MKRLLAVVLLSAAVVAVATLASPSAPGEEATAFEPIEPSVLEEALRPRIVAHVDPAVPGVHRPGPIPAAPADRGLVRAVDRRTPGANLTQQLYELRAAQNRRQQERLKQEIAELLAARKVAVNKEDASTARMLSLRAAKLQGRLKTLSLGATAFELPASEPAEK